MATEREADEGPAIVCHRPLCELVFGGALAEIRGVSGVHLAILAAKFGLSVEGELAAVIPAEDDGGRRFGPNDLRRQFPLK